jgi:hypothetical protein
MCFEKSYAAQADIIAASKLGILEETQASRKLGNDRFWEGSLLLCLDLNDREREEKVVAEYWF